MQNRRFNLFWGKPIQLLEQTKEHSASSITFADALRDKEILANPAIKSALIRFIKTQFVAPESANLQAHDAVRPKRLSNIFYAMASGVACTEVLLSIGWTVISVLIGVDAILPISNWTWGIFAISCIIAGTLFGIGMGLSRHKERKVQLIHLSYQEKHKVLNQTIENLHHLLTEHIFLKRGLISLS
ncbi:MAG: hypothetical protein EPN84_01195 [Legionella sp.]|nr:MAG: hypothetical protein EPN84_01195 [Legionella sp.]